MIKNILRMGLQYNKWISLLLMGILCSIWQINAYAKGIFIKGGYEISPHHELSKSWMVAFGFDHAVSKRILLGFEAQIGYYRNKGDQFEPATSYTRVNAFFNIKYAGSHEKFRPFIGTGAGIAHDGDLNGLIIHFIAGMEINITQKIILISDFQPWFIAGAAGGLFFFTGIKW